MFAVIKDKERKSKLVDHVKKRREKKKECKYKWRRPKVPGHGFPHSDLLTLLSPK